MPAVRLTPARVEDALVRDAAALAPVEHREVRVQPLGDVVGVEDGDLARAREPVGRPSCAMYAHEMSRMLALPHGAALTGADAPARRRPGRPGARGRNGARCARRRWAPCPGPPPPCGMQNVLCRFRWQTSAPMSAGRQRPTCAFMFAPSMYTWPPCSWTIAQISLDVFLEDAVRRRVRDHQRGEARSRAPWPWPRGRRGRCCPSRRRRRRRRACRPSPPTRGSCRARWPG